MLGMSSINYPIPLRVEPVETFVFLPAPMQPLTGPVSSADLIESSGTLCFREALPRMNNEEFLLLDVVPIKEVDRGVCAR
jgi:hypothetical protein